VILVDSSVWIDHFRRPSAQLAALLASRVVWIHPFVVGELACGHLPRREAVFTAMSALPHAPVVPHDEVLAFVERHRLMARGIGWVDMHLLASTLVAGRVALWSRDKRLAAAAAELGCLHKPHLH
jgi:predicted nucleic acid-binding protein